MTDTKQSRGFAGAVLKLLRAGDYELTVTGRTQVSPHYLRLSFAHYHENAIEVGVERLAKVLKP